VSKPDGRFKGGTKLAVAFFLRKMVKIPARPFLFWSNRDIEVIRTRIVDYVVRGKSSTGAAMIGRMLD
jgi:phage gpG-like protein